MNSKAADPEQSWATAFDTLKADLSLTDDAIGVFAINLRFGLDDIQAIASESVTGGGDDKKCDIIYVDKERQIAVVAQCYISKKNRDAAPSNKASDLNTAIAWLLSASIDALPDGLKGRAEELRSSIKSKEIRQLHVWYVHNLPPSKNVRDELLAVEATARNALNNLDGGQEINVFSDEICGKSLEKLYAQAERTVIVTDEMQTIVSDAFEINSSDWTTLSTVVKGAWLRDIYAKYQTDLFSANLRGYLGSRQSDSNINNGIESTASSEPENFFVYNNGITALVLDFELGRRRKSGRLLKIQGISIVNGAQTTGSLASIGQGPDDELQVAVRFVKSNRDSIVSKVVQYNNTQNKIQAADFRSTDPIQDRLRSEFLTVPDAEYEGGRRGGASDTIRRSKYALPSYTVGQALAAFHGDPVTAYDKKSELWTNENKYRQIFTERTSARHVVFCYSLLSELNAKKLSLQSIAKTGVLTASQDRALNFLNKKGAPYLIVSVASQCMETIIGRPIPNKVDLQFKRNISPLSGEKIWQPISDMLLSLSNQLDGAFSRDRISNDSVQKAVPNFVGVVDSLSELHHQTFSSFADHVELKH